MLYESAVIKDKSEKYRKRTSVSDKDGYEEHSNCCYLLFTILVGVLAIIALILVFLLVFGAISAKKCKECDVTTITSKCFTEFLQVYIVAMYRMLFFYNHFTVYKHRFIRELKKNYYLFIYLFSSS